MVQHISDKPWILVIWWPSTDTTEMLLRDSKRVVYTVRALTVLPCGEVDGP